MLIQRPDDDDGKPVHLPPGFVPLSFEAWLAEFLPTLPTIAIELAKIADPRSTDTEIGPGIEVIKRLEANKLIAFAINPQGEPAAFAASQKNFTADADLAAAAGVIGWFDRSGDFNTKTGAIESERGVSLGPEVSLEEFLAFAPESIKAVAESARVSRRVVEETYRRWIAAGVFKAVSAVGPHGRKAITAFFPEGVPRLPTRTEQEIVRAFFHHFKTEYPKGSEQVRITVQQWLLESTIDARRIAFSANVTGDELAEAFFRFEQGDWIAIRRMREEGGRRTDRIQVRIPEGTVLSDPEQRVVDALRHFHDPKPRGSTANYVRAVETQYLALATLQEAAKQAHRKGMKYFDRIPVSTLWGVDIEGLRRAETYCWFPEPIDAVSYAAESMLMSVRLTRDLTESDAGWWYFTQPLPIQTIAAADAGVMALLWQWRKNPEGDTYGVVFSAYVWMVEEGRAVPMPSTFFFWPEGQPLQDALEGFRDVYRKQYGSSQPAGPGLMGEAATLAVIEKLARFWVSGALWVQQKLLVYAKGHIERHARKRMEREVFQRPLSDIQIVQLRRRESIQREKRPGDGTPVDWKCRWVVAGHWRNQWFPGRGIYKPIYIESYPKGPDDLPLKVPTKRVYVVNR